MCKILHFQHLGHVITILHALMHWIRWQATFAIFKLSIKCHTEWNFCWMEQYGIEWWIASSNKHINKHVLNKSKWLRCWSKEISRMHVNDIGTVRWYYENQWIFNALKIKTKFFFSISNDILCYKFTHLPLQVAQKCSRVPHLFIVPVKSKWSKKGRFVMYSASITCVCHLS